MNPVRVFGLALGLVASQAYADKQGMMDILGGYGCTLSVESRVALHDAAHDESEISAVSEKLLADGRARQERDYVVFAEEVCTIRLPVIENEAQLSDPDIAAAITAIDHYEADARAYAEEDGRTYKGEGEGCYFQDMPAVFDQRKGGERGAGGVDYIRFLGAHVASGDVRFYGPNPLQTPISLRVVKGACGETAQGAAIKASHRFVTEHFGDYVRRVGQTPCDKAPDGRGMQLGVELQGGDTQSGEAPQQPVNAWLYFELDLITYAAGWYEGMSGTSKGTPRPPLCTYNSVD